MEYGLQASAADDGEESRRAATAATQHCKAAVAARNGSGAASRLSAANVAEASEENRKSDHLVCGHLEAIIDATIGASAHLQSELRLATSAHL